MQKKDYGLRWIFWKTKGVRFHLLIYSVLVLIGIVLDMSTAYFLMLFVDIATGDVDISLLLVGVLALAVISLGGVFTLLSSVLSKNIYGKIECNLRLELMNTILSRRLANISRQHSGILLTKFTVDIQAISNCFLMIIHKMVGGASSAIFATIALFFLNWKMALIMIVLTPTLMLIMKLLTPFIEKASHIDKQNEENNRSIMQENLSRIVLIKTYFMHKKTTEKMRKAYVYKLKSGMKLGMWEGLASFLGMFVSYALFMVSLGVGAYFVLQGEATVGSLIAIVQLLNYIVGPVSGFADVLSQISQAVASSNRLKEIYEMPENNETMVNGIVNATELIGENLSFSYNDDSENVEPILKNVEISFSKGMVTGLVGKSGSGKSTLLRLLIGLYEHQQGKVILKHSSGTLSGTDILSQVAYVPPVDYIFAGTVSENIIMSEEELRFEDMQKATSEANILDFIQSLPQGFETPIGEGSGAISSGQAQRIAIARAIYKKSPIIVFDEPTANLDVESIEKFQSAVQRLAKDKICIIVTHDISTISVCDKVYILEDGCVSEKPVYEELK